MLLANATQGLFQLLDWQLRRAFSGCSAVSSGTVARLLERFKNALVNDGGGPNSKGYPKSKDDAYVLALSEKAPDAAQAAQASSSSSSSSPQRKNAAARRAPPNPPASVLVVDEEAWVGVDDLVLCLRQLFPPPPPQSQQGQQTATAAAAAPAAGAGPNNAADFEREQILKQSAALAPALFGGGEAFLATAAAVAGTVGSLVEPMIRPALLAMAFAVPLSDGFSQTSHQPQAAATVNANSSSSSGERSKLVVSWFDFSTLVQVLLNHLAAGNPEDWRRLRADADAKLRRLFSSYSSDRKSVV